MPSSPSAIWAASGWPPDKIERLDAIASRTWLRTLDDRLGISREELKLRQKEPSSKLPCLEPLLADKCWHLVPRPDGDRFDEHNPWGFKVKVPHHLYNRGERYNLAISRGTLTEEERYKINEHIIQTIRMLEHLPFPPSSALRARDCRRSSRADGWQGLPTPADRSTDERTSPHHGYRRYFRGADRQ